MFGQKIKEGERPPESKETKSLTSREIDIMRLILEEYSSIEIADILNISINTVNTYRRNLLIKTKAKNTVGLAKFALKHKII